MSSIGPALPPHLQNRVKDNAEELKTELQHPKVSEPAATNEEEEEDSFGPALPPHLLAKRKNAIASSSAPPAHSPPRSTVTKNVGPTLPPHLAARREYQSDSDDDDDDVGPSIHMASRGESAGDGVREFLEREARIAKEREEAAKPKEMKRDEWMLVPPENADFVKTIDPLKGRGFSRMAIEPKKAQDMTLWTETPAERQQRLRDEVIGKKRKAENAGPTMTDEEIADMKRRKKRDAEIANSINQHNTTLRGKTLVDQHAQKLSSSDKSKNPGGGDEAAPGIWDRDSMMGVSGKLMTERDRSKAITDARALNDRFGHSKRESKKRSLTTVCEELLAPHIDNGLVVEVVDYSVPLVSDAKRAETNETPAAKRVCMLSSATTVAQQGGGNKPVVPTYPLQIRHVVCKHCDLLYTLEESIPPTKQCVSDEPVNVVLPVYAQRLTVLTLFVRSLAQIDCGKSAIWNLCNPAAGCHCLSNLSREMQDLYSKAMRV
ncbi:hypothetical protein QFC22_001742 [Naganishia vaughanmartiniae]|uniref:Uncharacterized protein n=1 Tax=Naganishia vaughanmartiniae TaxID=1424756 RepID=A0ACC2XH08_9TREE|nr:hypothetical protein QFC22_001742 [Naganishia vaughanmartiniae]